MDMEEAGRIMNSPRRQRLMGRLKDNPRTPSRLTDELDYAHISSVSAVLSDLREAGLVELLVPEETRKGRVYGLTERGEKVLEFAQLEDDGA